MSRSLWKVLDLAILSLIVCFGPPACGDDDHDTDADTGADADVPAEAEAEAGADADADVDADADADDGGPMGTLSVLVLGPAVWPDYEWNPVAGAAVAFDRPDGTREESTTDATGRASFDGFNWSDGPGAVTAGLDGFGLASLVGLDGSDDDVTLVLPSIEDPTAGWVDLSVTAINLAPGATEWEVIGVGLGLSCYAKGVPGNTLSIRVPPGVAFAIEAESWHGTYLEGGVDQEFFGWAIVDHDPVTAPAAVEIDFADAVVPTTVSGSFALPTRADSPLRTHQPYAVVFTMIGPNPGRQFSPVFTGAVGAAAHIQRTTDGNMVDYDIQYTTRSDAAEFVTWYDLGVFGGTACSRNSHVWVPGYPGNGPQDFVHLEMPEFVVPATPSLVHGLHEPFEWVLPETGVTPTLYVKGSREDLADTDLWWISAPTDATTLTVPQPPTAIDAEALLGTEPLRARIGILADDPGVAWAKDAQTWCGRVQP